MLMLDLVLGDICTEKPILCQKHLCFFFHKIWKYFKHSVWLPIHIQATETENHRADDNMVTMVTQVFAGCNGNTSTWKSVVTIEVAAVVAGIMTRILFWGGWPWVDDDSLPVCCCNNNGNKYCQSVHFDSGQLAGTFGAFMSDKIQMYMCF